MDEDKLITEISVLTLRQGDVLVFKTDKVLDTRTADNIRESIYTTLRAAAAPIVPVLVVDREISFEVIRQEPPFITRSELPNLLRDLQKRGVISF